MLNKMCLTAFSNEITEVLTLMEGQVESLSSLDEEEWIDVPSSRKSNII